MQKKQNDEYLIFVQVELNKLSNSADHKMIEKINDWKLNLIRGYDTIWKPTQKWNEH